LADNNFDTPQTFGGEHQSGKTQRPLLEAMTRGFLCRCPNCGQGRLFKSFTKTVDECSVCGLDISHHRADDLPAYLVIMIVGHVVVAGFMGAELMLDWTSWQHLALWVPLTIIMALALLQPVKGAVIGLQWAYYMHGFGGEDDKIDTHPEQTLHG
jgi:uncharacterized protein (DUF983 family)